MGIKGETGIGKLKRAEKISAHLTRYKQPEDFSLTDFAPGSRVLVAGCGEGALLRELVQKGFQVSATDAAAYYVEQLAREGFTVQQAPPDQLPFSAMSFDGIVSSGVLSTTDERQSVAEWARVLAAGGEVRLSCQGFGHALLCCVSALDWRTRVYGVRMILNTWVYRLSGRRLPGWPGNALCQSETRLRSYYKQHGFTISRRYVSAQRYLGQPVFIYHHLQKRQPS